MEIIEKIVDFTFCKTCKNEDCKDYLDPCHDCLNNPVNANSKRPVNYKEDEEKVKKLEKEKEKVNEE